MQDLMQSVRQINETEGIDFVLVTGDITEEGDRASMQQVKSCLDHLKMDYHVVMGNHETKWSDSGCTAFGDIFGYERFSFMHKGFRFIGFNSGPLMRMAYGHVVPQDITWMKEQMESDPEVPVFIVTHYPLLEGDVDNWYEVTDAIRPYNVRLCIGGHYHKNLELRYDGIPAVLVRSNLRDDVGTPGYALYEVTADSVNVFQHNVGEEATKWASFSLREQYYDREGKAEKYPDFSVNQEYDNVRMQWLLQTGVGIYSSPATDGRMVYVGDDMGEMTAYSIKSGRKKWSFKADNRIIGTPAVENGIVVFGAADGRIYGLDSRNGREKWRVYADAPVLGAVTIADGIAYVGASDHKMRAIEISTGKVMWEYDGVEGYIETKPLVTEDKVIFGAWDNTLYALGRTDGHLLWKWTGDIKGMHYSPAAVWPVAAKGKVFITDPQRAMTAVDIETGSTVWRTYESMVRETIGLSEDLSRVYSKTMRDLIVCYSTEGNEPVKLWESNLGFGYEHAPSMQAEKDGIVYGSTVEGLLFALDAFDGKIIWKYKVCNSLINTVVPLDGHRLLFTTTSGEVGLAYTLH